MPLQRPPLSKAYLGADTAEEENFYLRRADWFTEQDITLKDGVGVTAIHRVDKTLTLSDGTSQPYDELILALGASPRRLPMAEMDAKGVHVLRDGADAKALKTDLASPHRRLWSVAYIGLEAAASLRKHGLSVTVVEAADRLLARVASPSISSYYQSLHEGHDVTILTIQASLL